MLPLPLRLISIAVLMLSTSGFFCLSVVAQEDSTTDSKIDKRVQEANARKAQFEAERAASEAETAAIEARKAAFGANLPSSNSITAPTGTITVDSELGTLSIEAQILTYRALKGAMPSFVNAAKKRKINLDNSKIVIQVGEAQEVKNALDAYNTYRFQTEILVNACKSAGIKLKDLVTPQEDQESPIPIGALLDAPIEISKSIASLLALFRSETTIAPAIGTDIEPNALVSELAATLNEKFKNVVIYNPKLFSPKSGLPFIVSDLDRLATCSRSARSDEKLEELSTAINTFFAQLLGSESDKVAPFLPKIVNVAKGARITAILNSNSGNSFVLYAGTKAGGTNRVTRNLFTGTKLRHSGGVIFYYELHDSTGSIQLSGVESFYTGFQNVSTDSPISSP